MYHIHETGSAVNIDAIIDYLANRPKFNGVFKANDGVGYLVEASKNAHPETFNYYYDRMKKFSLLRGYESIGMDVSFIYDVNGSITDLKKRQQQEDWLDATSLVNIADTIDKRIDTIRGEYVEDDLGLGNQAGDGIFDLIQGLKERPEVGIPLYG